MDLKEKMVAIEGMVASNKLSVSKKFNLEFVTQHDFYSEAREVANGAIDKIYELCVSGVNEGFTGAMKDAIHDLSQVVVDLTKVKDGEFRKLNNYKKQVEKVSMIKNKKPTSGPDPREALYKYIDTTISAVDSILTHDELFGKNAEAQRDNLRALKKKLTQLSEALTRISNFTSKQAVDCANRITRELLYVRQKLSILFCTREVVSHLDVAITEANNWAQLTSATGRRDYAKQDDFPYYVEDNISALANSDQTLDELRLFRERFANEENRIENSATLQSWRARVAQIDADLQQVDAEEQAVIRELQNTGNRQKAASMAQDLQRRRQKLEGEKANLNNQINRQQNINDNRMKVLTTFKRDLYEPIMAEMQDNPMHLCVTLSLMDFGSVLSMLTTDFTENDINAAFRTLMTARVQAEKRDEELNGMLSRLDTVLGIAEQREQQRMQELGIFDSNKTQNQNQQGEDALEALLARHGQTTDGGEKQQQTTEADKIRTSVPLTDDDK